MNIWCSLSLTLLQLPSDPGFENEEFDLSVPSAIRKRWNSVAPLQSQTSYFEGWFYRITDGSELNLAIIPGKFRSRERNYDFVQVYDDIDNNLVYFETEPTDCETENEVVIGDCMFRPDRFRLCFDSHEVSIEADAEFSNLTPWNSPYRHPAMGWFSWIPRMQCNHSIISLNHKATGRIRIGKNPKDFTDGCGYLEKTWGKRFPDAWIWSQCFMFDDNIDCMFFSLATVPMLGTSFFGLTAAVVINGQLKKWGSWRSETARLHFDGDDVVAVARGWKEDLIVRWKDAVPACYQPANVLVPTVDGLRMGVTESLDQTLELTVKSRNTGDTICHSLGTNAAVDLVNVETMKANNV